MKLNNSTDCQNANLLSLRDTTTYADKLPISTNNALKSFTGAECLMVRKIKDKDKNKIKNKAGNCHINVQFYVEKFGGKSVSGWILNRNSLYLDRDMYVWSFHSVWEKPDGKWVDVTDDKHYMGRDKSIFIADSKRVPDLVEGRAYNNFAIFNEPKYAAHFGASIGVELITNRIYWTDTSMMRMLDSEHHDGVYRWLNAEYPRNIEMMCEEYELEIVDGKPKPKPGSKYENMPGFPTKMLFDYSLSTRG